jgi:hypothetical protein
VEKIKDRVVLGVVAGLAGNAIKTTIDMASVRAKISQRSFRQTAAGVWVSNRKEANSIKGQLLGGLLDFGMGILGGIGMAYHLSLTGKDHAALKGIVSGIAMGSAITYFIGCTPNNQLRPTDATSNLSYMLSHAAYGLVAAAVAAALGDPSLFGASRQDEGQ